jgi:hypothetical protein
MATATVTQTYANEFQRPGIAAADADASVLPAISLAPGQSVRIGASCGQPNATLALRLYFLDSNGRVVTVQPIAFTSGAAADWAATFNGSPPFDPCFPISGARNLVIKADSVSAGSTWNVCGAWA